VTRLPVSRLVRDMAYRLAVATRYPAYRRRRGAAVFAFHNVVADHGVPERCDRSLHVGLTEFQDYVSVVTDGYTVVPLIEIAERVRHRNNVDGLAALTFDDAYLGVVTHAVPVLARQRLPATLFVVSGSAAAPAPFWWDLLGVNGDIPAAVRERALRDLRGDRDMVLAEHQVSHAGMPSEFLPAGWRDVRAAAREGVSIGSHTASHYNLAALDVSAVLRELERARAEIGAALGTLPAAVSYPYGFHNDSVLDAARRAGYTTGVTLQFGLVTRDSDPLALPRINVPAGISLPALECWAAGLRLRGAS
jgi:peptidoglycan/xylan/chitin deacetylase (PgdA/CDA1 family)